MQFGSCQVIDKVDIGTSTVLSVISGCARVTIGGTGRPSTTRASKTNRSWTKRHISVMTVTMKRRVGTTCSSIGKAAVPGKREKKNEKRRNEKEDRRIMMPEE